MSVSEKANLIYNDGIFRFYTEDLDEEGKIVLKILDSHNCGVYSFQFLSKFKAKVFRGKSGTYVYYKVTFSKDDVCQELVLLPLSVQILKPIYLDSSFVSKSKTRLVIRTKKDGLSIKREVKKECL